MYEIVESDDISDDNYSNKTLENNECDICELAFNKSSRSKIICPKCNLEVCKNCFKRWILEVVSNPRCMNTECKGEYSYEYLTKTLPQAWLNKEFREEKTKILLEREKSLLPESQKLLEDIKRAKLEEDYIRLEDTRMQSCKYERFALERLLERQFSNRFEDFYSNEEIDSLNKEIESFVLSENNLQEEIEKIVKNSKGKKVTNTQEYLEIKQRLNNVTNILAVHRTRILEIKKDNISEFLCSLGEHYGDETILPFKNEIDKYRELTQKIINFRFTNNTSSSPPPKQEKKEGFKFMVHCPKNGCRGFLSTGYKCGTCEAKVCPKCREILKKKEDHECDENKVKSVEAIKAETKPCPSCGVPIYKIDGCNDMWCWSCHIPFNYRTGRIDKTNTNPHLWEWRRNHGGNEHHGTGLDMCGRSIRNIADVVLFDYGYTNTCVRHIFDTLIHTRDIVMRNYIGSDPATVCSDLRVKYLSYEISEKEWARKTFLIHKKNEFNLEVRQALHVLVEAGTSILERMVDSGLKSANEIKRFRVELNNIKEYINKILFSICRRYGSSNKIYITDDWRRVRH